MKRLTAVLSFSLLAMALFSAGCENKEAAQLKDLNSKYQDLDKNHKQLQDLLADAQTKKNDLALQLETKDVQLQAANSEIARLKAMRVLPPTTVAKEKPVPAGWERTATGDKKTLASDILFAPGKAALSPGGEAELRHVAATIKSEYASATVRVLGYTDRDPIVKSAKLWDDNLDLSAGRAMAVTRFLEKCGLAADQIETIAMGETHPVTPNKTAADKAKNRRVEIMVVTSK